MAGTTQPIKLLIVDDDEDMRQDLSRLFRKQGHEVTAAVRGEDALNKAAHARFDVALLDLHLPDISGIDVLVKLKEQQPSASAGARSIASSRNITWSENGRAKPPRHVTNQLKERSSAQPMARLTVSFSCEKT